jgi:CheY-like chemotaxis protein
MKKNILVIDDSPFFLKILSDSFSDEFHVITTNSAEEAFELLNTSDRDTTHNPVSFDLVITDLNMPGQNGYDVAKFMRVKNREKKFTPVIMLTEMDISKEDARKHGCAAYIPKSDLKKVVSLARILLTK